MRVFYSLLPYLVTTGTAIRRHLPSLVLKRTVWVLRTPPWRTPPSRGLTTRRPPAPSGTSAAQWSLSRSCGSCWQRCRPSANGAAARCRQTWRGRAYRITSHGWVVTINVSDVGHLVIMPVCPSHVFLKYPLVWGGCPAAGRSRTRGCTRLLCGRLALEGLEGSHLPKHVHHHHFTGQSKVIFCKFVSKCK